MAKKTISPFTNKHGAPDRKSVTEVHVAAEPLAAPVTQIVSESPVVPDTRATRSVPAIPAIPEEHAVHFDESSPDELKAEIELTRFHMDENLAILGRKLSPQRLKSLQAPLAALFIGVVGILLFRRYRNGWQVKSRRKARAAKSRYDIETMRLGRMGRVGQLRTFLQLMSLARRGKPAVFIVHPVKA